MKILENYLFNIDGDEFLLRTADYSNTKVKENKYPLFQLDKIYIFDNGEDTKVLYNQLKKDIHYLILQIKLSNKKVFYVYPIDYKSPNQSMFWKFFYDEIDRKNRVKVIPYIKNNTSIFMKNNKPVMIGKKINVEFNQFEKVLQINLVLNNNFLIRKILNYILSKDKSVYVGLTIETYPEDYYGEELLCIFGLNSLSTIRT